MRPLTVVAATAHIGAFALDRTLLGMLGPREPIHLDTAPSNGQLADGGIYLGADPHAPAVGDVRIGYAVVHPEAASVIAQQDGNGFKAFTTRNGRDLLMIDAGEVPAQAMFREALSNNMLLTWVLRGAGAVAMLLGFYLLLRPMAVLADLVPLFGAIVAAGAGLIALMLTVVLAPLVIALAWLVVRPLVGGAVLAAGLVCGGLLLTRVRTRRLARA